MKRLFIYILISFFALFSPTAFAAQVIPDTELAMITGQSGIVANVVLDSLIGENFNQLSEGEKVKVRQLIENTFGPLSRQEIDQIINSHLLFVDMLQQLPEEDRRKIEEAYEIITAQLQATAPTDLLNAMNGGPLTADNLDDWAQDKINKILIAQEIINDMLRALSTDEYQQMMDVQEIVNGHFDTLKQ